MQFFIKRPLLGAGYAIFVQTSMLESLIHIKQPLFRGWSFLTKFSMNVLHTYTQQP